MDYLDINIAHVNDKIIIQDDHLIFPTRYLELYFADVLEDHDINYKICKNRVRISIDNGFLKNRKGLTTNIDREFLYHAQISSFHAQHWYPDLPGGSTFPSVLIPLTTSDVEAILHLKDIRDKIEIPRQGFYIGDDETVPVLNALIQKCIDHVPKFTEIFVRLNSVSPKHPSNKISLTSGWVTRVLDILIDSSRTCDTLRLPIDHFIMLRQWVNISPQDEFRCFIFRNRLTAISQYHCYQYFESLQGHDDAIRTKIMKFYKTIYPYIPYEDCVMDVVITPDCVQLVEFNSFGSDGMAGSALYNWLRDEPILYATQGPPDIRIVTEDINPYQWTV